MKIYVITNGIGSVDHAGTDEAAVRQWAEARRLSSGASAVEWRDDWGRVERLYHRDGRTGRWNKVPATFICTAELEES